MRPSISQAVFSPWKGKSGSGFAAGLSRRISWGEAQEQGRGMNSASPEAPVSSTAFPWAGSRGRIRSLEGLGREAGFGGVRMDASRAGVTTHAPHTPRMLLLGCFPPSLHTFQPGSAAESRLAGGGTRDLPGDKGASHRLSPHHEERLIKTTPGRKSTRHPH